MRLLTRVTAAFLVSTLLLSSAWWGVGASPAAHVAQDPAGGPRIRLQAGEFDPLVDPEPVGRLAGLRLDRYPGDGTGYYIVQFRGPVAAEYPEALAALGATVLDYLPDYAYVVKMDSAARSAVQELPAVRWTGLYQPAYRVSPDLADLLAFPPHDGAVELTVSVFAGEELAPVMAQVEAWGGIILAQSRTRWKSTLQVALDPSHLADLAACAGVRWTEPAPQWQLMNNEAVDIMGVRTVWNAHNLYGAGQVVGVADTGLDQGSTSPAALHDDLTNSAGVSRVLAILDVAGDGDVRDLTSGHGTHVAGSVLGNGVRSGSTPASHTYPPTAYAGVAPEASLVFQAAEPSSGRGLDLPPDLNDLFAQAASYGVAVHTNSWGSESTGEYTDDAAEVDEYIWDHPDFTILFSAGNSGTDKNPADGLVDLNSMASPATAKNCITVGASENDRPTWTDTWGSRWPSDFAVDPIRSDLVANRPDGMAAFSSRGPTRDGRTKPDVVAPGTHIVSTRSSVASGTGWGVVDSYYMSNGGTSMSSPLVAGAAVLAREFFTSRQGHIPSAALIKATLVNGATDINPGQYGTGATREIPRVRPTQVAGWGRVNLEESLFPSGGRILSYRDEKTGLNTGEVAVYPYQVTNSAGPLKITLAWSDYPGSPAAQNALVNDLDLQVSGPGGSVYFPNGSRGPSQDHTNNLLGIDIPNPDVGSYQITVSGVNVPHGRQPFALVVSGILGNTGPVISGLPDREVVVNTVFDNAVDLWAYTWDPQSPNPDLTFQITNAADPAVINAGVTLDSNRYIDVIPAVDWTGEAIVQVKATDPGGLFGTGSLKITVTKVRPVFLPLVVCNFPPPPAVVVSPQAGPVGTTFWFTGTHFAPNEAISSWIVAPDGYRADLDPFNASSSGTFAGWVRLTGGWPTGLYTYYARGAISQRTASIHFTITPSRSSSRSMAPSVANLGPRQPESDAMGSLSTKREMVAARSALW